MRRISIIFQVLKMECAGYPGFYQGEHAPPVFLVSCQACKHARMQTLVAVSLDFAYLVCFL